MSDIYKRMALDYCSIMGIDPHRMVASGPETNPDGSVNAVLITRPYWQVLMPQMRAFHAMDVALTRVVLADEHENGDGV